MKSEMDSSPGHAWIAKREVVAKSYVSKAGEFGWVGYKVSPKTNYK